MWDISGFFSQYLQHIQGSLNSINMYYRAIAVTNMAWAKARKRWKSGYGEEINKKLNMLLHLLLLLHLREFHQARGGHLQNQHGKEAQGAPPRKQEQCGQYLYKLKTKYQEEGWWPCRPRSRASEWGTASRPTSLLKSIMRRKSWSKSFSTMHSQISWICRNIISQ